MRNVTDDVLVPPPRPLTTGQSVPLNQFWKVLPAQSRRQVLATLSRIVAEHLPKPQTRREVDHDRY